MNNPDAVRALESQFCSPIEMFLEGKYTQYMFVCDIRYPGGDTGVRVFFTDHYYIDAWKDRSQSLSPEVRAVFVQDPHSKCECRRVLFVGGEIEREPDSCCGRITRIRAFDWEFDEIEI